MVVFLLHQLGVKQIRMGFLGPFFLFKALVLVTKIMKRCWKELSMCLNRWRFGDQRCQERKMLRRNVWQLLTVILYQILTTYRGFEVVGQIPKSILMALEIWSYVKTGQDNPWIKCITQIFFSYFTSIRSIQTTES